MQILGTSTSKTLPSCWPCCCNECVSTLSPWHPRCESLGAWKNLTLGFSESTFIHILVYIFKRSYLSTKDSLQRVCGAFKACNRAFRDLVPAWFYSKVEAEIESTLLGHCLLFKLHCHMTTIKILGSCIGMGMQSSWLCWPLRPHRRIWTRSLCLLRTWPNINKRLGSWQKFPLPLDVRCGTSRNVMWRSRRLQSLPAKTGVWFVTRVTYV